MRKRRLGKRELARPFPLSDKCEAIEIDSLREAMRSLFDGYLRGVMELDFSPFTSGSISISTERFALILRTVAKCADEKMIPHLAVYEEHGRLVFKISPFPNDSLELRLLLSEEAEAGGFGIYAAEDGFFLTAEIMGGVRMRFYAKSPEDIANALYRVFFTE